LPECNRLPNAKQSGVASVQQWARHISTGEKLNFKNSFDFLCATSVTLDPMAMYAAQLLVEERIANFNKAYGRHPDEPASDPAHMRCPPSRNLRAPKWQSVPWLQGSGRRRTGHPEAGQQAEVANPAQADQEGYAMLVDALRQVMGEMGIDPQKAQPVAAHRLIRGRAWLGVASGRRGFYAAAINCGADTKTS
jgi:hypothetical protein